MIDKSKLVFILISALVSINISYAETNSVELEHTDGYGLLEKPPLLSKFNSSKMFSQGKLLCDKQCATPFGQKLGVVDNTVAYSNCQSSCINPEYSFLNLKTNEVTIHKSDPKDINLHYIGVIYQCVEYSRKWWMKNKGITYASIDSAHEVIYLTEGQNIRTGQSFPLGRSINGTAKRPPKRGDLIVYYPNKENPSWRHGHIAVVVATDLESGTVSLAEENYDNKKWISPNTYSRKIRLFETSGRYTLLDIDVTKNKNKNGGLISGWIYPRENHGISLRDKK